MEDIVAFVGGIKFDIEWALENQIGAQPLPFPGMDKSGSAVCTFFLHASCDKENACPFRHVKGDRSVVCKHWLRGLCKKGDDCEFLHEYDMSKMPECYFFSKFGQCGNKECPFLHIDPEKKLKDCPWYDRGFCRHGPNCKNRHVRRVMCQNYLCGFCLDGPECKYVHPKFDIPPTESSLAAQAKKGGGIVCHICNQPGHKSYTCPKNTNISGNTQGRGNIHTGGHMHGGQRHIPTNMGDQTDKPNQQRRALVDVTCFKCNERGHYANRCPKGHLAFLSSALPQEQAPMEH